MVKYQGSQLVPVYNRYQCQICGKRDIIVALV